MREGWTLLARRGRLGRCQGVCLHVGPTMAWTVRGAGQALGGSWSHSAISCLTPPGVKGSTEVRVTLFDQPDSGALTAAYSAPRVEAVQPWALATSGGNVLQVRSSPLCPLSVSFPGWWSARGTWCVVTESLDQPGTFRQ